MRLDAIPNGDGLWQAIGGPRAWSDEFAGLMRVDHDLRILAWQQTEDGSKGKNQPEMATPPPFASEQAAAEEKALTKAERHALMLEQYEKHSQLNSAVA